MSTKHQEREPILQPGWAESERFVPKTFVQPVLTFMRLEASGGILMLIAAVVAVIWANSGASDLYFAIFDAHIDIAFGDFHFHHLSHLTVRKWINDAAMVIFFFVVGLEIKREVVVGELHDPKAAALPAMAALGGMVVPAAVYLAFNAGGEFAHGWGIPMATDIAFAVGVVAMAGSRVPVGAKLFLLALAIVDDLGAIAVIALVYTESVSMAWLLAAVVGLVVTFAMNRAGIRSVAAYCIIGAIVWLCVLESGVHATIAGVAMALLTPVRSLYSPAKFPGRARLMVDKIEERLPEDLSDFSQSDHNTMERVESELSNLRRLASETVSPQDRLELVLQPWSAYVIVPIFALANAGVVIDADALSGLTSDPVTLGVSLGLLGGKVLGVTAFAFAAVKLGLGKLPRNTTWRHMIGMGLLSGIGFTVALFVASLAFEVPAASDASKIGIFAGSILAGLSGFLLLRFGPEPGDDAAEAH